MGVPKFFAYLMKKFKNSNFIFQKEKSDNKDVKNIDWFLIDTNSLIHPICFKILDDENLKSNNIDFKNLENKMINAVIEYIEKIIDYAKPNKGIYIAIDGPVACSKMKQQRQRRFRSTYDREFFNKIKEKYNKPKTFFWSNSCISPGTKFMSKLHEKIIYWCKNKLNKSIQIIYSSANTPGEGEHKILQFIKNNQKNNIYYSYLTYGLDADLIFLMLVTGQNNIYLLREATQFDNNASKDQLNYVSIKIMKECIFNVFNTQFKTLIENKELYLEKINLNEKRIINDFIFLCYFLGNDFLPHLQSLNISKNAIEYIIKNYMLVYLNLFDYLVSDDIKTINSLFLNNFLLKLGDEEESILTINLNKKNKFNKCNSNDPYEKELFKIDNLHFKIDDPIGLGVDSNYRNNYYKHYYDVENDEKFIKEMVKQYLIGIKWIELYYFDKIVDWYWFYPYDYPPLLCDIAKYYIDINEITFKLNKPISPIEQLLMILPPQTNFLLPKKFSKIVINPKSSISYLYPIDFHIDFLYKHKYYEGIPILPQLEIKSIIHIFKKYKDELSIDEIKRNEIMDEFIF